MLRKKLFSRENDYLFCTIYGDQLTRAGLARAIQNYNRRRGLIKPPRIYLDILLPSCGLKMEEIFSGCKRY